MNAPHRHPWSQARLVAGLTLRDLRRNHGAWRLPAMSSALFALLFLGSAVVSQSLQERAATITFNVALDGDLEGASDFLHVLDDPHLIPQPDLDAETAVRDSDAVIGIVVPDDLDARIATGEPLSIVIHQREGSGSAPEAIGWLLGSIHRKYGEGFAVQFATEDATSDADANLDQFARSLSAMSAFLCLGVVTSVASLLGSTRDRRGAEPLLVLPLPRESIAAGTAFGATPMGMVYLGTAIGVLVLAALLPLPTLGQSLSTVVSMLPTLAFGVALLALLAAALGVVAGALGGGADDSVGIGDLLAMPFAAIGVMLLAVPNIPTNAVSAAVPGVGTLLVVRDGVKDDLAVGPALIAIAATAVTVALLLALAARLLGAERNVRR